MQLLETIKNEPSILVYFQNDNCPPCLSLRPKIEEMIKNDFPKMKLVFVDSAANPTLSADFKVFANPTLLVFFEGQEFIRASKYVSVVELKGKIQRLYKISHE
jgi:thioredoxin 1